jgi:hypothetical protein
MKVAVLVSHFLFSRSESRWHLGQTDDVWKAFVASSGLVRQQQYEEVHSWGGPDGPSNWSTSYKVGTESATPQQSKGLAAQALMQRSVQVLEILQRAEVLSAPKRNILQVSTDSRLNCAMTHLT